MKIEDRISSYMALLQTQQPKQNQKSTTSSSASTTAEARTFEVALSAAAVQMSDDEARRNRLENIRHQLAEGSYNISGKDVANKILTVLKG